MKFKLLILTAFCLIFSVANAQDLLIYHPKKDEKIKIFDSNKQLFTNKSLHLKQGDKFNVKVLNPNPLFYKYEIRYEEQEDEAEDKAVSDALALLNIALSSKIIPGRATGTFMVEPTFEMYKDTINQLMNEIKKAQTIINDSDVPESQADALSSNRNNGGLKYAIDQITGKAAPSVILKLSSAKFHFRSPTISTDINELLNLVTGLDEMTKNALMLLNNSLIQKITEIKKSMNEVESELESEFVVKNKITKVFLTIKPIDPKNTDLIRKSNNGDENFEIATIIPDYKRSTIELVPVGNFILTNQVKEFYLENNIVKSRLKSKISFTPGIVVNINIANFGNRKEMAFGIGPGYKFSNNSEVLENFYFSTLFSYKNFLRIGMGLGFAQFPHDLKNGIQENQLLPPNVDNLEDIINYQEKLTGFLTIAFTGLNLTKKE